MSGSHYVLVDFDPPGLRVGVKSGTSLLEAARRAGIRLEASCGGQGDCGQCRVIVISGQVSVITEFERENLTPAELQKNNRLACSAQALGSVKIQIAPRALSKS